MATEQLKKIIADVESNRIVLPQFQRDFVWQPSAVLKLLTSLFNGYPIGSMLLMENNDSYDYRPIDGVPELKDIKDRDTLLVLDGQQRLTACYRAFVGTLVATRHSGRYYFNYSSFVDKIKQGEEVDGSALEDYFVFVKPSKIAKELNNTSDETSKGLFPLDIIFKEPRGSNYADWLSRYNFAFAKGSSDEFEKLARISSRFQTDFIEKVTGYQINYEKITRDTKPDVICTVFETINTTGVKLTVFDLLVAKSFKKGIRLRDNLEDAASRFENIKYFDPNGTLIASSYLPRIIGLMYNGQCKKGDLLQLPVEAIAENWDKSVSALDKILGIMRHEFGCIKYEFIPSIDVVSPLSIMVSDVRFSRERHFAKLSRLYWNLVFSLYLSGAPETKSARLVREWRQDNGYRDNDEALPEVIRTFGFSPEEIDDATKTSTIYRGIITLLISNGARDFGIGNALLKDVKEPNIIEDHHIYPQQFLRNFGIKGYGANAILNRTPILSETNKMIGAEAPHIYILNSKIVGSGGLSDGILEAHAITKSKISQDFSKEVFSEFVSNRRKKIMRLIAKATGHDLPQVLDEAHVHMSESEYAE
ncbi:GmrSD restriction endonuclease domain-containing protein [Methylobacterium indicum]|uniref:GmrSD restriction endonuclease domain-containing protein n=1 Tax=Methylobacterium indicum TaxID=1775910 RepID=UPI0009E42525|nr:DUF262 domain-containing protein [Methylobacterium indicum]